MVERAAELARDSRARTGHAAVLVADGSLLAWAPAGFPGGGRCCCRFAQSGNHDQYRTHAGQRAITLGREGDSWRRLQGPELIYMQLEADSSVWLEMPLGRAVAGPGDRGAGGRR